MTDDPRRWHLTSEELRDGGLTAPPGWALDGGGLRRTFTFGSYREGLNFVVQVATLAEARGHHPDLTLGYRRVTAVYFTHDAGRITRLDVDGARAVNALLGEVG